MISKLICLLSPTLLSLLIGMTTSAAQFSKFHLRFSIGSPLFRLNFNQPYVCTILTIDLLIDLSDVIGTFHGLRVLIFSFNGKLWRTKLFSAIHFWVLMLHTLPFECMRYSCMFSIHMTKCKCAIDWIFRWGSTVVTLKKGNFCIRRKRA